MSVDKIFSLGVESSDTTLLSAATYVGGGQTIVKLIPEALIEAESLAQATLGLNLSEAHPVGKSEPRAVGFPAWPIIHDPDNARHALNLVGDLEWARRYAKNQAKKVKDRFDALAGDLTNSAPHFVPTLFEELARIFSAVGNEKFAKQYFGRAREVERAHGVPVDPARHEAAFLEFAQSGVVGTKDMTQEATDAPHRFDSPEAAFEYVLHLNIARVRAGQPPYAYLARDLRKLGKAAGLSANEVDARLFDGIVGLSAVQKAPGGFWKAMRAPLIAWLKSNPDRGEAFLSHQPKEFSMEDWLAFLDESGAWQHLVADDEAFLAWMQSILKRQSYELGRFSPRLLAAFELIGDALRGTRVVGGIRQLPLEYVDALVAGGAQWDLTSRWSRDGVDWHEWAKQATRSRDLRALAAHPEISELAVKSLSSGFVPESLDLLLAVPGAKELLSRHLDRIASRVVAAQGAFAELAKLINQDLRYLTNPRLMELNPQAMKTMTAFDAQAGLSWAIRAGVLAELAWPTLDESIARLQAAAPGKQIKLINSHPDLFVVCGDQFEVISGASVRITGELPANIHIESAFSVGDEAVFFYRTQSSSKVHVYWNGGLGREVDGYSSGYFRGSLPVSIPVPGGRLTGNGLLKSGATDHSYSPGVLVSSLNSDQIFALNYRGGSRWITDEEKFSEPEEMPEIWAQLDLDEIGIADSKDRLEPTIFPAFASTKDSLAGTLNGKHVTIRSESEGTYRAVTPLGTFSSPANFHYALNRPGGGVWLSRDLTLIDAESGNHLSRYSGYLDKLPTHAVHQLHPRSIKASKSMRSCTNSDAKKLLAKLRPEPGRRASDEAADTRPYWKRSPVQEKVSNITVNSEIGSPAWKAASKFLHSNDPVLVRAVVELAADAAALELQIARLRQKLVTPPPVVVKPVNRELSADAAALFGDLIDWRPFSDIYRNVPEAFEATWARLQTVKTKERQPRIGENLVYKLIGHERALLGMLAAQASDKPAVQELSELFREFTKSGLLCSGWRSVFIPQKSVEWKNGEWIDGALVVGPKGYDGYEVLIFGVRPAIAGFPVVEGSDKRISAEDFLAGLSALETDAEISRDENAAELARKTTLAPDFCTYLMGGVAGRSRLRWGKVLDERLDIHRKALGFSITAFKTAHAQLEFEPWSLLQAMYAASVPLSYPAAVATHPDISAMAAAWSAEVGDKGYRITEAQHSAVLRAIEPLPLGDDQRILRPLDLQNDRYSADYRYIAPLLTLAANSRGDDPIRPFIAQQLETNREYIEQQKSDKTYRDHIQDIELGDSFNKLKGSHSIQATRVLTEGLVDELIEDLKHPYESPAGHPLDPLVSAPKVVADMATNLGLNEDSARHYLQVLALTTPTDVLIREWNDWTKKDLDAAAAPLIDRGLLITAKRSGAGRTRFLPGGWLDAASGEKGFEVWKAPHYLLWKDPKVHPVVRTCPPLVPVPQLYSDVWARYQSGDVPGYEELRTQRYRRR